MSTAFETPSHIDSTEHVELDSYENVSQAGHALNLVAGVLENRKDDEFHPLGERILVNRQDEVNPNGDPISTNEVLITAPDKSHYSFVSITNTKKHIETYTLGYEPPAGRSGAYQVEGYSSDEGDSVGMSADPAKFTMLATEITEELRDALEELNDTEKLKAALEVLPVHDRREHAKKGLSGALGWLQKFSGSSR